MSSTERSRSQSRALHAEISPVQARPQSSPPAKEPRRPFYAPLHKSHRGLERPPFECIALVLQGGGALGAFQAGVSMTDHWKAGYHDAIRTLRHPEALQRPVNRTGIATFDLAVNGRE